MVMDIRDRAPKLRLPNGLQNGTEVRDIVVAGRPEFNSTIWFIGGSNLYNNVKFAQTVRYKKKLVPITDMIGMCEDLSGGISNSQRDAYHDDIMADIMDRLAQSSPKMYSDKRFRYDLISGNELHRQMINLIDLNDNNSVSNVNAFKNDEQYYHVMYTEARNEKIESLMLKENKLKDILFTEETLGNDYGVPLGQAKILIHTDPVDIPSLKNCDESKIIEISHGYMYLYITFNNFCDCLPDRYNHLDYRTRKVVENLCGQILSEEKDMDKYFYFTKFDADIVSGIMSPRDLIASIGAYI